MSENTSTKSTSQFGLASNQDIAVLKGSALHQAVNNYKKLVTFNLNQIVKEFNTTYGAQNKLTGAKVTLSWGFDITTGRKILTMSGYIPHDELEEEILEKIIESLCDTFALKYSKWSEDSGCHASFDIIKEDKHSKEIRISTITMPVYNDEESVDDKLKVMMEEAKEEAKV